MFNYLIEQKLQHGRMYKDSLYHFLEEHEMGDAHEEALMRAFQRWRKKEKEERDPSRVRGF